MLVCLVGDVEGVVMARGHVEMAAEGGLEVETVVVRAAVRAAVKAVVAMVAVMAVVAKAAVMVGVVAEMAALRECLGLAAEEKARVGLAKEAEVKLVGVAAVRVAAARVAPAAAAKEMAAMEVAAMGAGSVEATAVAVRGGAAWSAAAKEVATAKEAEARVVGTAVVAMALGDPGRAAAVAGVAALVELGVVGWVVAVARAEEMVAEAVWARAWDLGCMEQAVLDLAAEEVQAQGRATAQAVAVASAVRMGGAVTATAQRVVAGREEETRAARAADATGMVVEGGMDLEKAAAAAAEGSLEAGVAATLAAATAVVAAMAAAAARVAASAMAQLVEVVPAEVAKGGVLADRNQRNPTQSRKSDTGYPPRHHHTSHPAQTGRSWHTPLLVVGEAMVVGVARAVWAAWVAAMGEEGSSRQELGQAGGAAAGWARAGLAAAAVLAAAAGAARAAGSASARAYKSPRSDHGLHPGWRPCKRAALWAGRPSLRWCPRRPRRSQR